MMLVIFTSNKIIYGKEYGSGKCYYCTQCGAYIGTHEPNPSLALGTLANEDIRKMRMKCHELFDAKWKKEKGTKKKHLARNNEYRKLAIALGIPVEECHFGYFNMQMLQEAYELLSNSELLKAKIQEKVMCQ